MQTKSTESGGTDTFQALQYALENLEDDLGAISNANHISTPHFLPSSLLFHLLCFIFFYFKNIYLLSDGDPTRGEENVDNIVSILIFSFPSFSLILPFPYPVFATFLLFQVFYAFHTNFFELQDKICEGEYSKTIETCYHPRNCCSPR